MHLEWLIVSAVGLVIAGLSIVGARFPRLHPAEIRVFHAVNGLPNPLYAVLWLPMQLGNLVVGTVVGLVAGLIAGSVAVAIGVIVAMLLKLVTERILRREMAEYLSVRQRPGTSQVGAILRGRDVPSSGPSFPSGHVILVTGVACVVAPKIDPVWWWVPLLLILCVMVGRVFVGAHNPLDVTAGLGAGLIVGGLIAALVT
jgi:undecaprenyl-diphosphatase